MSPIIENPLMYGGRIDWDAVRTNKSVRCTRCQKVLPGVHMAELVEGVCRECREKEERDK